MTQASSVRRQTFMNETLASDMDFTDDTAHSMSGVAKAKGLPRKKDEATSLLTKPRETIVGELMGKINRDMQEDSLSDSYRHDTKSGGALLKQFDYSKLESTSNDDQAKLRLTRGDSNISASPLYGVMPSNLDSLEKTIQSDEPKEVLLNPSFAAHFIGKDSEAGTSDQTATHEPPKRSIKGVVEKFGFVEMTQIETLFKESKKNEEEAEKLEAVGETYVEQLIDKEKYIEDILEMPLFVTDILNVVNSALQGTYNSTICAFAVSKQNTLAVFGTENGEIIEIIVKDKPIVKKHSMDSKVTAVAVSPNEEYFVAGTMNSEVTFQRSNSKLARKQIKNLNQQKVTQIIFTENNAVLVATIFNLYYFTIGGMSILMDVTMTPVMPRQMYPILQLSSIYFDSILRIIVTFTDRISLYGLTKEDKKEPVVFKVGGDIEDVDVNTSPTNNKWPPVVDWMEPDGDNMSSIFLVFWKNKITMVDFGSNDWTGIKTRKLGTKIVWGKVFDARLLCMLTTDLQFEFLSINKIFTKGFKYEGTNSKMMITQAILKDDRDKTYIYKYKDKLEDLSIDINLKLPFFQFWRNRLKDTKSEIFMITDNGLLKYRLVTLDKIVEYYRARNDHLSALKLINNIFLNRIFSKAAERNTLKADVPDVVKSYVDKKFSPEMFTDDMRYLLDVCIETLMYSGNTIAIFEEVKSKFPPKIFWEEISKFIRNKKLKTVPYEALADESSYLDNSDVIEILKNFQIESQVEDEETINKVLKIVKKKNIWPFLYKFCIFYPAQSVPTFLSMLAAEILSKRAKIGDNSTSVWLDPTTLEIDRVFESEHIILLFRVFWFFNLVLGAGSLESSLSYFTQNPDQLVNSIPEVYAKTIEWVLDEGNLKTIVDISPVMFFELIFQCMMNIPLLKTAKVIDVIKKIKNIYLKKNEQTNSPKFVANFRATQALNTDPYPFSVAENFLIILEDLLDPKYQQQLGFLIVKLLHFGNHELKFENQEWICCSLLMAMKKIFKDNTFWEGFESVKQETFEDLLISVIHKIDSFKYISELKKEITELAFEQK